MQGPVLFEEVQSPGKNNMTPFLRAKTFLAVGCVAAAVLSQNETIKEVAVVILTTAIIFGLLSFFISGTKLITRIYTDGICIRYAPFQRSFLRFGWEEVQQVYMRQYNPLVDYTGWGLKIGPMGTSYTVSGTLGVQLVLNDGRRILIGTNAPEDMVTVLRQLRRLDGIG